MKIIRETDMFGVLDPSAVGGREDPKFSFEFPSREQFNIMSVDQLSKFSISKVKWQGDVGVDAIQFFGNDGLESPALAMVGSEMTECSFNNVRKIDIWWKS